MKIYTYQELENKTIDELIKIKKAKAQELVKLKDKKSIVIGNIMSLQGLINQEQI